MTDSISWKGKSRIPIVTKQFSCAVPVDELMFIEKKDGIVRIATVGAEIFSNLSMKELAEGLDGRDNIHACHSYLIINFNFVTRMENGYIYFSNRKRVRLGEKNFAKARKRYNGFICGAANESDTRNAPAKGAKKAR